MHLHTVFFILAFVFQTLNVHILADEPQLLAIGAIFEERGSPREYAFLEAIHYANQLISNNSELFRDRLIPRIEFINKGDTFQAAKKVCELLRDGIIGLLGPTDPFVAYHLASLSTQFNVPFLQTHWDHWHIEQNFSINLHPHYKRFSEAVEAFITGQNWDGLVVLYHDEKSLLKYEPIITEFSRRLLFRRWRLDAEKHKFITRFLKKSTHRRFIVDIPYWEVKDFLIMAAMYNMTTSNYAYLFPDWDVQQLDLSSFRINNGANITTLSIILAEEDAKKFESYSSLLNKTHEAEQAMHTRDIQKILPAQAALVYDAVLLLTHALIRVSKTSKIQPKKLQCEGPQFWQHGASVMEAISRITQDTPVKGYTGNIYLKSGQRDDYRMTILQAYHDKFHQIGYWTNPLGLQWTPPKVTTIDEGIVALSNSTLRVTTYVDMPFAFPKKEDENGVPLPEPEHWDGFCMELLKEIAADLKFNFTVHRVKDGKYGSYDTLSDGTMGWNGMIGELINKQADMAVASFTITYEREKAIDFTTPFMNLGLSIIIRKPQGQKPTLFSFLQPLSPPVWGYILAVYVLVSFVLCAVARFSPYEWRNPFPCNRTSEFTENQFNILNSMWFSAGSLMQQGTEYTPRATSTRIIAGIWRFFTLIIISSYTANLAAFLTVERMVSPVNSAEDLSKQTKIEYGTLASGSTYSFFEKSSIETYQNMFKYMNSTKRVFVQSVSAGVTRAKQSNYAFILESTMNEYYVQRDCSLMPVGGLLDSKGYGIGLPQGSPYRDRISESILRLQNAQVIEKLRRKWWREFNITKSCDTEEKGKDASALGVEQVGGVFVMLFIGIGLSFCVSLVEFVYRSRKEAQENHQKPMCDRIGSELKFAVQCMGSSKRRRGDEALLLSRPTFHSYGDLEQAVREEKQRQPLTTSAKRPNLHPIQSTPAALSLEGYNAPSKNKLYPSAYARQGPKTQRLLSPLSDLMSDRVNLHSTYIGQSVYDTGHISPVFNGENVKHYPSAAMRGQVQC